MNMNAFRSIRRTFYGVFLNKYQVSVVFILIFVVLCFSHFGEILSRVINDSKSDIPYCAEPIDVVYTWVNGSDPHFRDALKHCLNKVNYKFKDSTDERFDDKYELKFSLRSLEKYAPWVRHVYIVTNGQIPYWLNLDYEKVSIVTHEDIFVDKTDVPTFSSPAIESNIHRISGLSNKFIYFNDDIFLGAPTYPEDFVLPNRGYLIYQAWPLPSCSPNCPWTYVGDGQCDTSCYNFDCQFDGGDCGKDYDGSKLNSHRIRNENGEDDSDELKNPIDYEYYEDERQDNVIKRNTLYNETAKISVENMNKTKGMSIVNDTRRLSNLQWTQSVVEQISVVKKIMNNNSHISDIINEHNRKVMLSDKLHRRKRLFGPLTKRKKHYKRMFNVSHDTITNSTYLKRNSYSIQHGDTARTDRVLDTYALSLQNTNRVFNLVYGYKSRKVPAHSPILIDKNIMNNLQRKFKKEFEVTRKNKFRSANDMQYSFSYYYYLINEKRAVNISDIFDKFDSDNSSTWSDREIRTVLTKINDLPLSYHMVKIFDSAIINCSKTFRGPQVTVPSYERYIDSKLPTVSKQLVENCPDLVKLLTKHFGVAKKYQYEIVKNAMSQHVMFKMLTSNVSDVVGHLDEIRKESRKFVCLNDNMDSKKIEENELVRAVLLDFYLSLFPKPSMFELPQEYRNRFTYVKDLLEWRQHHMKLKVFLLVCVVSLCSVSFYNICKRRLLRQIKKIIYL